MDKQKQVELLKIVKDNYEEIAAEFDLTRQKPLWPELVKLAADVKNGDSVLDVGCGNGRLVSALRGREINYLGIDSSEKLVNLAEENFKSLNYKFQVGDILELDNIIEGKFDRIFCIAVLHHLPGQELRLQALEQLKNRLNPGGKIVLTAWNLWSRWKYISLILKFTLLKLIGKNRMDFGDIVFGWGGDKSQRYYHSFTESGLLKLSRLAEMKVETIYKDLYNYYLVIERP